jgi:predicted dehydrogenase/threonine dehydrogenase-like Zn-dependent dehydrogenase
MKQVMQDMRHGNTNLLDVPPPQLSKGQVLVATKSSLISAGTEKMLMDFAQKSLAGKAKERPDLVKKVIEKVQRDGLAATVRAVFSQLDAPLPLGYSAAGEVLEVADDIAHLYSVGDRVVIAGAGIANHAEVNAVPKNLIAKMPDDVTYQEGCYATLCAIAMHGFRNAQTALGESVLVVGLGLVGQLTAQFAAAAGCRVMAMDFDANRIKTALENGTETGCNLKSDDANSMVSNFTGGKGFDNIIICAATDSNAPIENAAEWARDRATVVMTGMVGTKIPYAAYMKKEIRFVISRSYGPGRYDPNYEEKGQDYPIGYVRWTERDNLEEAARLMSSGDLDVKALTTHSFDIDKVQDAYNLVTSGEPCLGVVLNYPSTTEERMKSSVKIRPVEVVTGEVGLASIGAGAFSRAILLPALKNIKGVNLTGVVTRSGASARAVADKFGFGFASADMEEVLKDENTNTVLVATLHNTHAELVTKALEAGKHVFVEKPLALTMEEYDMVRTAYEKSGKLLMVGFNRRFAPFVQAMQEHFNTITAPRQVTIRINAGHLGDGNWQNDPAIGGGRLLGEGCHFIDLGIYLSGSKPVDVYTCQGVGQDVYNVVMRCEDGSTVNVLYTSDGDSAFSKEQIEVFSNGSIGVIDNYKEAFITTNGKRKKFSTTAQDKGHKNELVAFVRAIKGEEPLSILTCEDSFESSRITLLAKESMEQNKVIKL